MKAEPAIQRELLQLVDFDHQIVQLKHRQKNLPQLPELAKLQGQRVKIAEQLVADQTKLSDLQLELKRNEGDLNPARARLERNQKTIEAGQLAAKALQVMIDESQHLSARISKLEDDQLELLEAVEQAGKQVEMLSAKRVEIENQMRMLLAEKDQTSNEIASQLGAVSQQRAELTKNIPAELLTRYEKLAARLGSGASSLRANRCTGCGLQLGTTELKLIAEASADDVLTCAECGRILVRELG